MVRKFIGILIPVALIGVSILIMVSGGYLKKPTGEYDNVPKLFEIVRSDIMNERWDDVMHATESAEIAYKKVRKRIQFSVERDEANRIEDNLARIKGFAAAKDKSGALADLAEASNLWEELGK